MPSHDERVRRQYADTQSKENDAGKLRLALRLLLGKYLEMGGNAEDAVVKQAKVALGDEKADFRSALRGMKL